MSEIILSICIVTHNDVEFIERAVDSVLIQNNHSIEVIIVDDGSSDGTSELCDKLQSENDRISVIHTEWKGLVSGRSIGIQHARGKYISFLDADDWLDPNMFDDALRIMEYKKYVDIFVFGMKYNWFNGREEYVLTPKDDECLSMCKAVEGLFTWDLYRWELCGKLYRRTLFQHDVMDETVTICEDLDRNWILFRRARAVYYSSKLFYHYFQNENSMTRKLDYHSAPVSVFERIVNSDFHFSDDVWDLICNKYLVLLRDDLRDRSFFEEKVNSEEICRDRECLIRIIRSQWNVFDENKATYKVLSEYIESKDFTWEWFDQWNNTIDEIDGLDDVYIYGAGLVCTFFLNLLRKRGKRVSGILVSNEIKKKTLDEYSVEIFNKDNSKNYTIVLAINEEKQREVVRMANRRVKKIICLNCVGIF